MMRHKVTNDMGSSVLHENSVIPIRKTGSEQLISNSRKIAFIKTLYRNPTAEEQAELDQIIKHIRD